jgi:hypothetical protein
LDVDGRYPACLLFVKIKYGVMRELWRSVFWLQKSSQ